jgi:arginyl-tRNA synthetase
VITGDVRRAIARAIAAEGLPPAEPGLRPAGVPGQYGSSVAFAFGERRAELAARITARLRQADGIARAEVTGPAFITVTIAPEELAALPDRIISAGPGCAESDALNGVVIPAPPAGDPLAEASWEQARAALAAQLTARLAAAAGATVAAPASMERSVSARDRHEPAVNGEATDRYSGNPARPLASPRPAETEGARASASAGQGARGGDRPAGPATQTGRPPAAASGPRRAPAPPPANTVASAVAFAGADAVRFSLARAAPGRPPAIEGAEIARHVMTNPAYAVRYAHARAASGVRWAAPSPAVTLGGRAALRPLPADPGELVLLDALSWLPERVAAAARRGRPDEFARYLEELASATIAALIGAGHPNGHRAATDRLPKAAQAGLAAGLGLLGVGAPDRL